MYILSTTFVVEPSAHAQWYEFFTSKYLTTLADRRVVFCRVLTSEGDKHYTYSLQVDVEDILDYQTFETESIGSCMEFCAEMFGERVLHFSTLLKKITL